MRTLLSIVLLLILGIIVKIIVPYVLTVLSFPGRLIVLPNASGKCSKFRFIFGTMVSTILQSYVYLAYTAFVVDLTILAMRKQGVSFAALIAAFFAVFFPLGAAVTDARKKMGEAERLYRRGSDESTQNKSNERERILDMAVRSSSITCLLVLIGFFVFAFIPRVMEIIYSWVTFINASY